MSYLSQLREKERRDKLIANQTEDVKKQIVKQKADILKQEAQEKAIDEILKRNSLLK